MIRALAKRLRDQGHEQPGVVKMRLVSDLFSSDGGSKSGQASGSTDSSGRPSQAQATRAGPGSKSRCNREVKEGYRDVLAHHVVGSPASGDSPISIGCDASEIAPRDLLINLCDEVPVAVDSFPRVAELVTSDQDSKQRSRIRYASYRDQGHDLNTHKL